MIYLVAPYTIDGITPASIEEVDEYLDSLKEFTIDCETSPKEEFKWYDQAGLDPHTTDVVMLQMGDQKRQYVIDTRFEDASRLMRHITDDDKTKIGVNLKFDIKQLLNQWGVMWNNIYDCMVVEMVLHQGKSTPKGFYGLQGMSKRYLNYEYYDVNQLALWPHLSLKKNIRSEFSSAGMQPFTKTQIYYGATDVSLPIMIKRQQSKIVSKHNLEQCALLENRFTVVLAEMEHAGFYLDEDMWLANEQKYKLKLADAENTLNQYLKDNDLEEFEGINWNSSQQVCVLFEHLEIPIKVIDKSKSTDSKKVYKKTVAETHISKYKDKFDIVKPYLEYKHMSKLVSTYGEKFLENINPVTGRVHSNYYQILNTGRISSSAPNMQNIPNEEKRPGFRSCFINSSPDTRLVVADYSAQESRVLASVSKEPNMLAFFNGEDTDMHSYTARRMFGVEVSKTVNAHLRQVGKVLNFSIAYGASAHKVQDTFQVSLNEAKSFIDKFYKSYPTLKTYFTMVQARTLQDGYILIDKLTKRRAYHPQQDRFEFLDNMSKHYKRCGWKLPYPLYKEYTRLLGELKRNSQNWPIQGLSGSMTKLAGILFRNWVIKNGYYERANIVNIVHDEILVECDSSISEPVSKALQESMEKAGSIFVEDIPMPASPMISYHWEH